MAVARQVTREKTKSTAKQMDQATSFRQVWWVLFHNFEETMPDTLLVMMLLLLDGVLVGESTLVGDAPGTTTTCSALLLLLFLLR
eukprot:CAMPEP_0177402496 /NCGR_PEP_ID=MMETSP0368-20130122/60267_1 /TAXON_ID=447022 ORGANISM="Scrippsiella hangoei-like, Strain SHHI-4" /NCGR_SAMPLE_ID=MMETSP0368 /ASSEMBLY_ACC=CAM_ASM_000363 /LENGTH=84 /DNA_ID=CAMNT_0018870253 /DNA_START=39 /DNA_END=290 /DNA_ORIENTATION=+